MSSVGDTLVKTLLPGISWLLHRLPLKSRLGGVSTTVARIFNLARHDEMWPARLQNGLVIHVPLNDYNGSMLYLFGTPDPKVVETCGALLRPGDVFLDIGANYGTVGLLNYERLGTKGVLHFVEPQAELCRSIQQVLHDNEVSNAFVHQIGLWDENNERVLFVPEHHVGQGSFMKKRDEGGVCVTVRSTSEFLNETVGNRAFGAKLDVEGAEIKILPHIFQNKNLRFVLFECLRPEVRDFAWRAAAEQQVALFGLVQNLFTVRLKYVQHADDLKQFRDVLALPVMPEACPTRAVSPRELGLIQPA